MPVCNPPQAEIAIQVASDNPVTLKAQGSSSKYKALLETFKEDELKTLLLQLRAHFSY